MSFYPIYLTRLDEQKVVLLGGNPEAERKCEELLAFNINLTVISPYLTSAMFTWQAEGRFTWLERTYQPGDLSGVSLAIAAEYDGEIGRLFAGEANERGIPVNVMDNLPLSNFAFGTIVKKGKLTVSMSSSGLAPALIVRLKERLNRELDDAYADFLELAEKIRGPVIAHIDDFALKKEKWYAWVDSDTISHLREGNRDRALEETEKIWGPEILKAAGIFGPVSSL